MSITDELREYFGKSKGMFTDHVLAIADRIDAEHEAMLADARKTVYQGLIELPKDADGEYIHVGDVMEWPTTGETFEVVGIGDGTLFYVEDGSECADWTGASTKRHHHAPTVEDVLREFALKAAGRECMTMRSDLVDEYASKLQLREDA